MNQEAPATLSHKPKGRMYIPLPLIVIVAIIIIGGLVAFGWLVYHKRSGLITISQKQIVAASPLVKQVGAPVSTLPSDNTMHLLIYYDGYSNPAVAQRYVGLIEATLKSTEPYASATNLEVSVLSSGKSKCQVQKSVKNLLKCDSSLISEVNKLHFAHFKLAIISPLNFVPNATVARGKNSAFYVPTYQGQLTQKEIDTFVSLYFLHELGHSFGLRDEYILTRYGSASDDLADQAKNSGSIAYQPAAPNCAPSKTVAEQWWSNYVKAGVSSVGYYPGCAGDQSNYYPVQGTVMGDDPTDATYGRVSEDYIRGVLDCFYGGKSTITYPSGDNFSGLVTSCKTFESRYPNFWNS